MRPIARQELVTATGGKPLGGAGGPPVTALYTDTRRPVPGGLFVALAGPNHDGHDYLSQALDKGAGGVVVASTDGLPETLPEGVLVLRVGDTREALRRLGALARDHLTAKVVVITGSVGKTTIKDMAAAALAPFGKVGQTPGNYNNDIGLPLALWGLDGDEELVVLEVGMSAPGEIATLTRIARPDVALLSSVAAAHLAFFPDLDAIADAKAELYENLPDGGIAVANADDGRVLERAQRHCPSGLITYGRDADATCRVRRHTCDRAGLSVTIDCRGESIELSFNALGGHNADNAAAALAIACALQLDLAVAARSLAERFRPAPHRMTLVSGARGLSILDDAYNANPRSTHAALDTFGKLAASAEQRAAVLGSMLELGSASPELHREVGRVAARTGVDVLFATGPFASAIAEGARDAGLASVAVAADAADIADAVRDFAGPDRWLLLKGSRGGRLERLLEVLLPADEQQPAEVG